MWIPHKKSYHEKVETDKRLSECHPKDSNLCGLLYVWNSHALWNWRRFITLPISHFLSLVFILLGLSVCAWFDNFLLNVIGLILAGIAYIFVEYLLRIFLFPVRQNWSSGDLRLFIYGLLPLSVPLIVFFSYSQFYPNSVFAYFWNADNRYWYYSFFLAGQIISFVRIWTIRDEQPPSLSFEFMDSQGHIRQANPYDPNERKRLELFSSLGIVQAHIILGKYYQDLGTEDAQIQAYQLFVKAADRKDPIGCLHLARCFIRGIGTDVDLKFAYKALRNSIFLGNSQAMVLMALLIENSILQSSDYDPDWLIESASRRGEKVAKLIRWSGKNHTFKLSELKIAYEGAIEYDDLIKEYNDLLTTP